MKIKKPVPKPLSKTAVARRAGTPGSSGTSYDDTMFTGGKPLAIVYVTSGGKARYNSQGHLLKVERESPYIMHKGKRVSFPRIPNARAWALENGYAGIRVELL